MAKNTQLFGKHIQRKSAELPWLFRFNVNGKTYSGSTLTTNRKEAEAFAKARKAEALDKARKNEMLGLDGRITFGQACELWWSEQGRHNVTDQSATVTWLRQQLGDNLLLQDIRASHVTRVREARRDTLAFDDRKVMDSTVNNTTARLRAILRHAHLHHDAPLAPIAWDKIMLALPEIDIRVLSVEEANALVAALRPDYRDVIAFALASAKRIEEILTLTWGQIDWTMAHPTMQLTTKGNKSMRDPLRAPELAILRRQLELQGGSPAKDARVFTFVATRTRTSTHGKNEIEHTRIKGKRYPIVYGSRSDHFDVAVKRAGLTDVTIHVLRHTAATWMLRAGVPIESVSRALNHSNIAVTLKYYAKVTAIEVGAAKDAIGDQVAAILQRANHQPLKLVAAQR